MIILKCAVYSFQKGHNLLKNNNINKILRRALDNNLTFKFIIGQSNLINSTLLQLVNEKFAIKYVCKTDHTCGYILLT